MVQHYICVLQLFTWSHCNPNSEEPTRISDLGFCTTSAVQGSWLGAPFSLELNSSPFFLLFMLTLSSILVCGDEMLPVCLSVCNSWVYWCFDWSFLQGNRRTPASLYIKGIFPKLVRSINQHFNALTPDGHTQLCCSVSLHGLTVGGSQLVYLQHSYPRLCEMNVFLMSCLGTRIPCWPSWCYAPLAGCWLLGKCTACTLVLFLCWEDRGTGQ